MRILKPRPSAQSDSADRGRRSFFWKLGAVSTALASTAGVARARTGDADDLSARVAALEEEQALRKLHQGYERAMDQGRYEEAVAMFADDAEVVFDGAVFSRRSQGVSRLYRDRFRTGKTGKRMEPAPGFELDAAQLEDRVEVSPDGKSAQAVFPYSIQVGTPIESETSLVSMARLHGEGVRTWWEGGLYDVSYVKDAANGRWKIGRLEYRTLSRADYRSGRSYASPLAAAPTNQADVG